MHVRLMTHCIDVPTSNETVSYIKPTDRELVMPESMQNKPVV